MENPRRGNLEGFPSRHDSIRAMRDIPGFTAAREKKVDRGKMEVQLPFKMLLK